MDGAARSPGFDELIHAPTRLSLMSLLSATHWAEFGRVGESLGLTDSALSKQVAKLQQAGYVVVRREGRGRGGRMHLSLSADGEAAFAEHVEALRRIVERADAAAGSAPPGPPPAEADPR